MKSLTDLMNENENINEKFNLNFDASNCIIDYNEEIVHIVMPKTAYGQWVKNEIVLVILYDEKSNISKEYNFYKNGDAGFIQIDDAYNVTSKKDNIYQYQDVFKNRDLSIIEIPGNNFVSLAFSNAD